MSRVRPQEHYIRELSIIEDMSGRRVSVIRASPRLTSPSPITNCGIPMTSRLYPFPSTRTKAQSIVFVDVNEINSPNCYVHSMFFPMMVERQLEADRV